jgi:hypothetical protein
MKPLEVAAAVWRNEAMRTSGEGQRSPRGRTGKRRSKPSRKSVAKSDIRLSSPRLAEAGSVAALDPDKKMDPRVERG